MQPTAVGELSHSDMWNSFLTERHTNSLDFVEETSAHRTMFLCGFTGKRCSFPRTIFVVELLDGFSRPRAPRWRRDKFQYPVNTYKDSKWEHVQCQPNRLLQKTSPICILRNTILVPTVSRCILTEGLPETFHVYVDKVWSSLLTHNLVAQRT